MKTREEFSELCAPASRALAQGTASVKFTFVGNDEDVAKLAAFYNAAHPAVVNGLCAEIAVLEKACATFEAACSCDGCDGKGNTVSGKPCGCKGTGSLAEQLYTTRDRVRQLESEIELLRKKCDAAIQENAKLANERNILRAGHHELCDVLELAPDLGPSYKPCNCRPTIERERQRAQDERATLEES